MWAAKLPKPTSWNSQPLPLNSTFPYYSFDIKRATEISSPSRCPPPQIHFFLYMQYLKTCSLETYRHISGTTLGIWYPGWLYSVIQARLRKGLFTWRNPPKKYLKGPTVKLGSRAVGVGNGGGTGDGGTNGALHTFLSQMGNAWVEHLGHHWLIIDSI